MVDNSDLIGVLLALHLLTGGDVHDSVPSHQLGVAAKRPQPEVDHTVATLVENGLAETVFITEGVTWVGITTKGTRVVSELVSRTTERH